MTLLSFPQEALYLSLFLTPYFQSISASRPSLPLYLAFVLVSASPSFLVYSFLLFFLGFSRVCRNPVILLGNTIGMDGFKFRFRLQLHRRSSALFSNDSFPAHCSHVGVRKVRYPTPPPKRCLLLFFYANAHRPICEKTAFCIFSRGSTGNL